MLEESKYLRKKATAPNPTSEISSLRTSDFSSGDMRAGYQSTMYLPNEGKKKERERGQERVSVGLDREEVGHAWSILRPPTAGRQRLEPIRLVPRGVRPELDSLHDSPWLGNP